MIVNELVTKFKFDTGNGFKKFDARLKHAKRDVDRTTKSMRGMFKRFGRSIKTNLRAKLDLRGVRKAKGDLRSVGSMARSLKSTIIGIGAGYVGFQALNSVMSRTLKVGSETEQLMSGLSTLRGPQQARRDMKNLQTMAAKTPFKVNELTNSFMRLNAAGFDVDINSMQKLGDLAANTTGKSIGDLTETMLSAARGQGAMVDNFNGMAGKAKNGGLEITSLDAKTGKLTKTMVKAGDKAALLGAYLKSASESDTQGAMKRLSETSKGLASTLSDNIDLALLQFYKALEPALKDVMKAAIEVAKSMKPIARNFGVFLKLNLPRYIDKIKRGFKFMKPLLKVAGTLMGIYVAHWVGFKALAVADLLIGAVGALRAMKGAQVASMFAQIGLNLAMSAMALAIGAVILAVAALAYDFSEFYRTGDSALLRFTEKWPKLHDAIKDVYIGIDAMGQGMMDLDSTMKWWSDNSSEYTNTVKNEYGMLFDAIAEYIASWIQYAVAKFDQFVLSASSAFSGVMTAAYNLGASILTAIMSPFNSIGQWLANLPALAANAFNGLANAAINAAGKIPVIGGGITSMLGRNKGGFIPGSGNTDTVPTMLTPGEFVINKPMVQDILSGSPRGLMKLQAQMRAPQMAMAGSSAISPQSVSTYSVPASSMTSNATNITINAPMTQTNTINSIGNSPAEMGAKLGNAAADRFSKGLSNAARQVPQRIGRV